MAAISGCAANALPPASGADPARDTFAVGFRYAADRPAPGNYLAFVRQAERVCTISNGQRMTSHRMNRACVEDLLDRGVVRMDRPQMAAIHDLRTGSHTDSSRTLAAR